MVTAMGFSEKMAKKAIKRIEIPEPTMIIDCILQGKVSDEEDDFEDEQEDEQLLKEQELLEKLRMGQEAQPE